MWSVVTFWHRISAEPGAGTGRGLRLGMTSICEADSSANFGTPLVAVSDGAVLTIVWTMPDLVSVVDVSIGMAEGAMAMRGGSEVGSG
jgi:hypothetical protein